MTGRSVTVRESEFTPDEVASLLASMRAANVRRSPTGYTIAEATDPDNADAFFVKRSPLGVPLPKRDYSVKALNGAQDDYYKMYPSAKGDSSLVWSVQRRE